MLQVYQFLGLPLHVWLKLIPHNGLTNLFIIMLMMS